MSTEYREKFPTISKKPFLKGCFAAILRHKYLQSRLIKIKMAIPPTKIAPARKSSSEVILACLVKSDNFILLFHENS